MVIYGHHPMPLLHAVVYATVGLYFRPNRIVSRIMSTLASNTSTGNCSSEPYRVALYLEVSLAVGGVVVCSTAIILAAVLKLHRQLLYRLAIYQVSSFIAFGATSALDIIQLPIITYSQSHDVYLPLCLAAAFLSTYTLLVKLFFTLIVTAHLFAFAVCYKNLKNLELCYVLTALIVPAIIAAVPFTTHTYGQQGQGQPWCWIQQADTSCTPHSIRAGLIEMFGLWFGPAMVGLVAISLLVVVMISVLAYRTCKESGGAIKSKVLLRQMLPLVTYPVAYCLFLAIPVSHNVYDAIPGEHGGDDVWDYVDEAADGGAIVSAGLALVAHMIIMLRSRAKDSQYPNFPTQRADAYKSSVTTGSCLLESDPTRSSTYYSFRSD